jgi:Skp family chaperone for outer membrane proteins
VQKKIVWAIGALVLGASVYVGSSLWAQTGPAPAAPASPPQPKTRIAFVNLAYILKHYDKVNALTADMKASYQVYERQAKDKKAMMEKYEAENAKPETPAAKREANLVEMTKLKRDIEDINNMAKKALGEKSDANTVTLYQEIQDAAARYAMANNFEMVLQFSDAFTQEDYSSPMNIMSKMQTRACLPMYYQSGNDISLQVVTNLNDAYKKANPGVVPAGTGAAPK